MNIVDIIFDKNFTNLDETFRFNGTSLKQEESVSQHTYWVMMFAYLIIDNMFVVSNDKMKFQFTYQVMGKCLFHDFDETLTGDLLFSFKHNALNGDAIRACIKEYVDKFLLAYKEFHDEGIGETIQRCCKNEDDYIKHFVKICDWLACCKYEWQEVKRGGNAIEWNEIIVKSIDCLHKEIDIFLEITTLRVPSSDVKHLFGLINQNLFIKIQNDIRKIKYPTTPDYYVRSKETT